MVLENINKKFQVAIYTRVSTEKQVERGYSLEAQKKKGIEFCNSNKYTYKIFEEAGESAAKENLKNRPLLREILELATDGKIELIYATEQDRISRNPANLCIIQETLRKCDVKIVTAGKTFDMGNAEDEFMSSFYGILAKKENTDRCKRSMRAREEAAKQNKWVGGVTPYGYSKRDSKIREERNLLEINPEEANVVRMIYGWSLEGIGSNKIALKLNAMGIPTRFTSQGRKGLVFKWKAGTVLQMLKKSRYMGRSVFNGHKISTPVIISEEMWNKVQVNLSKNYNNAERNTQRFYLLQHLLVCKKCGCRFFGMIKEKKGMRCYCCLSKRPNPEPRFCGTKNLHIDKINNLVWGEVSSIVKNSGKLKEAIKDQKDNSWVDATLHETESSLNAKAIQGKKEELDRLMELYTKSKTLSVADLDKKAGTIKSELEALEEMKQKLDTRAFQATEIKQKMKKVEDIMSSVAKRIDSFTDQEKYDFLHLFINRILVDYDSAVGHTIVIEGAIPLFDDKKPAGGDLSVSFKSKATLIPVK